MAVLTPADANNRSIRTQPSDVTDDVNDHLIATNFLVDIQTQNIWTHFHLIKFQFNFQRIKKKTRVTWWPCNGIKRFWKAVIDRIFPFATATRGPDPTHCLHNWRNYLLISDHFSEFHGREIFTQLPQFFLKKWIKSLNPLNFFFFKLTFVIKF